MVIAVLGISVPSFIMAAVLQYVLAMKLQIFPVARWESWAHTVFTSSRACFNPYGIYRTINSFEYA